MVQELKVFEQRNASDVSVRLSAATRWLRLKLERGHVDISKWVCGAGSPIFQKAVVQFDVKAHSLRTRWSRCFDEAVENTTGARGGPKYLFTEFEEGKIGEWIEYNRARDNAPTPMELRAFARRILDSRGSPLTDATCSDKWAREFMGRHEQVTRGARSKEQCRVGLTAAEVAEFFVTVDLAMASKKYDIIVNFDESGFHGYHDVLSGIKVVVGKDQRNHAYRSTSGVRNHVTFLDCIGISPDGNETYVFPPLSSCPTRRCSPPC